MCWRFLICWLSQKEISEFSSVVCVFPSFGLKKNNLPKTVKTCPLVQVKGAPGNLFASAGFQPLLGDKCHKMQGIAHLTCSWPRGRIHKS